MESWGVTTGQIAEVVQSVSLAQYGGNLELDHAFHTGKTERSSVTFTLRVKNSRKPGARFGHQRNKDGSRRRTASACWHAHRDVLYLLFARFPKARVRSYMADYHGVDEFKAQFPDTAFVNIGSMMDPQQMSDACECDE